MSEQSTRRLAALAVIAATLLACGLLAASPADLAAQVTSTTELEEGDRVRVWRAATVPQPVEYEFRGRREDTLVLTEPGAGSRTKVSLANVERLRVRRREGTHLLEGFLIGAGAGLVADVAWSMGSCASSGEGTSICPLVGVFILAPRTVLPGALLGLAVGSGFPDHGWVSVQVGPPARPSGSAAPSARVPPGRASAGAGLSVRLELHPPWLP